MNRTINKLLISASVAFVLALLLRTQGQSVRPQPIITGEPVQAEDSAEQTKPRGQLPEAVIAYATHLRELARQARTIEANIPQTPQEGVSNLCAFKAVLSQTRDVLLDILKRKEQIASEKDRVLESASRVQQSFINVAKKIGADAAQLRRKINGQPSAIQAVIQGHTVAQRAAERGAALVATLREQVVKDSLEVDDTLVELAEYRTLFDNLIEVCRLYIAGLGDTSDYNQMMRALIEAREALRQVVQSFAQAALNAERAVLKIPQPVQ